MDDIKNIGLVAHDNRKKDLAEWVKNNFDKLHKHKLICTGTTGRLVQEVMEQNLPAEKLKELNLREGDKAEINLVKKEYFNGFGICKGANTFEEAKESHIEFW